MKIEKKEVLIAQLSNDFYIQAEEDTVQDYPTYEFWLCRRNYGIRTSLWGVPTEQYKDLKTALESFEPTFQNFDYMSPYYDGLLEGDEYVDPRHLEVIEE